MHDRCSSAGTDRYPVHTTRRTSSHGLLAFVFFCNKLRACSRVLLYGICFKAAWSEFEIRCNFYTDTGFEVFVWRKCSVSECWIGDDGCNRARITQDVQQITRS